MVLTLLSSTLLKKRGVSSLLINSCDFSVLQSVWNREENILLARICKKGSNCELIIGSIYGSNRCEPAFFNNLRDLIELFDNLLIILGGDWNCSFSCLPRHLNIDILNVINPQNLRHSRLLKSVMQRKTFV
jgi:hypothetical protein